MDNRSTKGLKQERKRRQRISKIKNGIIGIVGIWVIVSTVICFTLMFRVDLLEEKMDYLLDNFTVSGQIDEDFKQTSGNTEESAYFDLESSTEVWTLDDNYLVAQAVNQQENLAKEGDVHKVYLTFDDGPSSNTGEILDILKKYGLKATFFTIGREDEESRALYKRIVEEGHTLGMHSYTHKYSSLYASEESFQEDFSRIQNYLFEVTGKECLFYRFPGGSSNHVSNTDMTKFIRYLNDQGITYFDWNVSSGDATSQAYTPEELVANVMKDVVKYKTSIVLMHDAEAKDNTVEALEPMILSLQGIGARILPIDDDTTVVQHIAASSVGNSDGQ